MAFGTVNYEAALNAKGERLVWPEEDRVWVYRFDARSQRPTDPRFREWRRDQFRAFLVRSWSRIRPHGRCSFRLGPTPAHLRSFQPSGPTPPTSVASQP
jgi:hypothetical protein